MAGELVDRKRTFVERHGHRFELPEQHDVDLVEIDGTTYVSLRAGTAGGLYAFHGMTEDDESVTVQVSVPIADQGPPAWVAEGEPFSSARGYPFPR